MPQVRPSALAHERSPSGIGAARNPGAVLSRSHRRELGLERWAVDAASRALGVVVPSVEGRRRRCKDAPHRRCSPRHTGEGAAQDERRQPRLTKAVADALGSEGAEGNGMLRSAAQRGEGVSPGA